MYCNSAQTVRVLIIDGGGVRGRLPLKFLQRFVQQWGIQPTELWKYFDLIGGTSIGGIMALACAFGISLDTLDSFFVTKAKRIFTIRTVPVGCDANSDSNRPNLAQKLALVALSEPFYASACLPDAGNSNYGSNILYATLLENFGTNTMQALKTKVVIPSYQVDTSSYVMFSNVNNPMFIGKDELITNVASATSAAPVYLPSVKFNNHEYIDGGIYNNNPAQIGLEQAKAFKPGANRYCVLSLGTGIGEMGFDPGNPSMVDPRVAGMIKSMGLTLDAKLLSTIGDIFGLFNKSSTGAQESIDFAMKLRANYGTESFYYYRFQPKLSLTINTELDNSDADFLQYMEDTAMQQYNTDIADITTFLGHLTA